MHIKKLLITALSALILALILIAGIMWRTTSAPTEILTSSSEDGNYSLTIYMIGEPEWPFGPTHCRCDLFLNDKKLIEHQFSIQNDGAIANESNFEIIWNTDSALLIVSGSEQSDAVHLLNFDGTIEQ
ncbi:MAG: hypothetical protein IJB67_04030 [Firmicutes bacterium]|nr:hypothetical protein [Bacillota bacterium]